MNRFVILILLFAIALLALTDAYGWGGWGNRGWGGGYGGGWNRGWGGGYGYRRGGYGGYYGR